MLKSFCLSSNILKYWQENVMVEFYEIVTMSMILEGFDDNEILQKILIINSENSEHVSK